MVTRERKEQLKDENIKKVVVKTTNSIVRKF